MPTDAATATPKTPATRTLVEAVVASTVGSIIEWYDFFLYGTTAALVFPRVFFPASDPFVGQILSFGTYSVGFIARPVGGIIFGYLGDRVGRKATLVATLLLMGVSTVLIGLLPGYDRFGPLAWILLTLLRFVQGLGVGGEWGGAVLMAVEYGHHGNRGFFASWPQTGVPLGLLLSTTVFGAFQHILPDEAFIAWGWRVPFLLSAALIALGFIIRARIPDTPLFEQLKASEQLAKTPVRETLRHHWREVLLAAGARLTENSCFYLFTVYVLVYGPNVVGIDKGLLLTAVQIAAAAEFFAMPILGLASDYWSRRGMYAIGCLLMMSFAFPYYALLESGNDVVIVIAIVLSLLCGHAILYTVQASWIPELFGTRVRCTGASLGYQLGSPFAGGLAPIIAATLVQYFPGQYWPLATYIIVISLISLACVQLLAETARKDIAT
jgi:metabolite-proton symporter